MSAKKIVTDPYDYDAFDKQSSRSAQRQWIWLASVCFLLAVVLRTVRINYREYFGIEFTTLNVISGDLKEPLISAYLHARHSLYSVLQSGWANIVGIENEGAMRVLPMVCGLLTCAVFFLFSRSYLRGTALTICLLIFALNPILVATSNTISPFAMLGMFVVLAHYFAIRALDNGGLLNWSVYTLAVIGGIATHPLFFFILPAHFLFALLRIKQTPKFFAVVSFAGLIGLSALAISTAAFAEKEFPAKVTTELPSSSELARGLVSIVMGNLYRYDAKDGNEFARGVMYLFVLICIILSFVYYRKREAEAMAVPDNVMFIDETQDVVGTWNRLSLRSFLLFQWFAFGIPVLCLFTTRSFLPDLRLEPELFLIVLPSLAVLMAMGIDAAPKEGALALGVLLLLGMSYYDLRTLKDRGFATKFIFEQIRDNKFNPETDVVIIARPERIRGSVNYYRGEIPVTEIANFSNRNEFNDRQRLLMDAVDDKERVFIVYHLDRQALGKTEERSPVREWFQYTENGFDPADKFTALSKEENTELRIYTRRPPGAPPVD